MTCREAVEALTECMEENLSRARTRRLERHRSSCVSCEAYRQTYEMTIWLEKAAFPSPGEASPLPESLVAAILSRRRLAIPLAAVE